MTSHQKTWRKNRKAFARVSQQLSRKVCPIVLRIVSQIRLQPLNIFAILSLFFFCADDPVRNHSAGAEVPRSFHRILKKQLEAGGAMIQKYQKFGGGENGSGSSGNAGDEEEEVDGFVLSPSTTAAGTALPSSPPPPPTGEVSTAAFPAEGEGQPGQRIPSAPSEAVLGIPRSGSFSSGSSGGHPRNALFVSGIIPPPLSSSPPHQEEGEGRTGELGEAGQSPGESDGKLVFEERVVEVDLDDPSWFDWSHVAALPPQVEGQPQDLRQAAAEAEDGEDEDEDVDADCGRWEEQELKSAISEAESSFLLSSPPRHRDRELDVVEPSMIEGDKSGGFVIVDSQTVDRALGDFIARLFLEHRDKHFRLLGEEELRALVNESIAKVVEEHDESTFATLWRWAKTVYTMYGWGSTALTLYRQPMVIKLGRFGFPVLAVVVAVVAACQHFFFPFFFSQCADLPFCFCCFSPASLLSSVLRGAWTVARWAVILIL